jgi:hypothetical protein
MHHDQNPLGRNRITTGEGVGSDERKGTDVEATT